MFKKALFASAALLTISNAYAVGIGYSSMPMMPSSKLLSSEITGITSNGGGLGFQGRFTYKFNQKTVLDGGIAINGGERPTRFFVGGDFEFFPDHGKQPKVSGRIQFENTEEFGDRKNIISFSPTASKGYNFWGFEAFPYAALPIGLELNTSQSTYTTRINAAVGITGHLPIAEVKDVLGRLETSVSLKDSYTALLLGLSFPIK